jgi:transcription antitermination factor NusG
MRWFALRCMSGSEFTAMAALNMRGHFAFSPVHNERRLVGRRRRPMLVRSAMLPGYVLAKLRHGYAAHECPLVKGVVSVGGEPVPLPELAVWDLLQRSGRSAHG